MVSSAKNGYRILTVLRTPAAKEPPHVALANLSPDEASLQRWRKQWGAIVSAEAGRELRLQTAGHPAQPHIVTGELLAVEFELQDWLRRAWRGDKDALHFVQQSISRQKGAWEFQSGRIELVPENLWSTICLMFLHDRALDKAAYCQWADCRTPYFRRNRKTQVYCSDVCQHEALLKQKRQWFRENRGKGPVTRLA